MKKYPMFDGIDSVEKAREKYDELLMFQSLLRTSDEFKLRFHGKAQEIADGIQPWIDALELSLTD